MGKHTAPIQVSARKLRFSFRLGIILIITQLAISGYGSTWIWSGGGGANGNWAISANWSSAGIPTNGDTLVFQGATGFNSTNNIANLTLNQIRFNSGGFSLSGDAFNLTNSLVATNASGINTINNVISNGAAGLAIIVSNTTSLTLNGAIGGAGTLTLNGSGTLTLGGTAANTYAGTTMVNSGTLLLHKTDGVAIPSALVIGSNAIVRLANSWQLYASTKSVTLSNSSLFDLAGFDEWVGSISLQGARITTGTGLLFFSDDITVNSSTVAQSVISGNAEIFGVTYTITNNGHYYSPDLVFSANISSSGDGVGLVKAGAGEVSLSGSNTFTGPVTVNGGDIWAQTATALGDTNYPATVNAGGTIFVDGSALDFGLKPLVLNGVGYSFGALTGNGSCSWEGSVTLANDSQIYPYGGASITMNGAISGAGALTLSGSGTLALSGTNANTYAGTTTVGSGSTLLLNKSISNQTIPGNLIINGTVNLGASEQITNTAAVTVNNGGLFNFGVYYEYIDTLQGLGTVNFGTNGWIYLGLNDGSSTFSGVFTGAGYAPGWTVGKTGNGTFIMNGNNTFSAGNIHILDGTMVINGSQPQSPVIVDSGATLAGIGTVGPIDASGMVSPGDSLGMMNASSVTFATTGEFNVNLAGPTPGSDYGQLNIAGANTISNATLIVTPAFTAPVAVGQQFDILNNSSASPVTGTFNGLAEGSAISTGGYDFTLSYLGGSGNDVVLTLTGIPGAVTTAAISSGNGNHAIDADECNSLNLVLTNNAAAPMNNISATLSTTTEGVLITQPYSDYATISANGNGTNTTPFQISTLPSFVGGTEINLQMIVNSSLGAYITPFVLPTGEASVTPFRYDVTGEISIPSPGTVDSTNSVSEFTGFPLEKVVVSLYLSASPDSVLTNISLIAPDGTTVLLSSANGGSGQNYGTSLTPDSNRTTFDDAATNPITNGLAPFIGTFQPQSPLATFIGNATPNGNWHLHLANSSGGSADILHGWSLFLYPTTNTDGGGNCDTCLPAISDAITAASNVQTNRWYRDGIVASCGAPKAWPGLGDTGTNFHYNAYIFTNNSGADACVTVELQSSNDVMAATYLFGYNAASISNNFWGNAGASTAEADDGITTYSSEIPNGAQFVVVVNEVNQAAGTQPYILTLSGLPCPSPSLNIQPATPKQAHLSWPTWAGGYTLEATPALNNTNWTGITNEPIVNTSRFNVTNSMNQTNEFYRLHKP